MTEPKGKKLIIVSSVLLLFLGIVCIIVGTGLDTMFGFSEAGLKSKAVLMIFATTVFVITGLVEVIAGFIGLKYANDSTKAKNLFYIGIVCVILTAGAVCLQTGSLWHVLATGFMSSLISIIYVIGAYLNEAK
ncbi:MAG: hypothetical protein RSE00_02610 [Clostridia bacterium]